MENNLDLSLLIEIQCEKCANVTFDAVFFLREVPASLSTSGQKGIIPIQAFACASCGHINPTFAPDKNIPKLEVS